MEGDLLAVHKNTTRSKWPNVVARIGDEVTLKRFEQMAALFDSFQEKLKTSMTLSST